MAPLHSAHCEDSLRQSTARPGGSTSQLMDWRGKGIFVPHFDARPVSVRSRVKVGTKNIDCALRVRVKPQGRPLRAGTKIRQSTSLPLHWPEPRGLRSAGPSVSLAQSMPFGTCPWAPSPPGPWPGGLIPSVGPRVAERCPGGEVAKVPYCCTLVSFWTPFWYLLFADFC